MANYSCIHASCHSHVLVGMLVSMCAFDARDAINLSYGVIIDITPTDCIASYIYLREYIHLARRIKQPIKAHAPVCRCACTNHKCRRDAHDRNSTHKGTGVEKRESNIIHASRAIDNQCVWTKR